MTIATQIPAGYIPLADYARAIGVHRNTASKAAAKGRVPGALPVQVPGQPRPLWFVPAGCLWRPGPVGRPREKK